MNSKEKQGIARKTHEQQGKAMNTKENHEKAKKNNKKQGKQ